MKHRRSIFLLLIITVVTLYCRVEFCYAAESSDITTRASTTATTAKTAGTAAELKALLTSSTDYTITLTADITISKKINIAGTKTIKGAGYKIIRNEGFTDARMLIVDAGSKLTLSDNLTVTGHRSKVESEAGIIKVESGGNLVVKDTVMINNNYSLSSGGGIYIKGTVTMSGGVITNSTCTGDGGGVYITSGGVFNMSGGSIYGNEAFLDGGGVAIASGGTFNFSGGTIYSNKGALGDGIYNNGTMNLSGTASIKTSNDVYNTRNNYIKTGSWSSPSKVKLSSDLQFGKIHVKNGAAYREYFSWSSDCDFSSTNPICVMGNDLGIGEYYTITLDYNAYDMGIEYVRKKYGDDLCFIYGPDYSMRTGYIFLGWFTDPVNGVEVSRISENANVTVYAHWQPKKYNLEYEACGGSVEPRSQEITFGTLYGEFPVPVRSGYEFVGWFDNPQGGLQYRSYFTVDRDYNRVLYAQWVPKNYTLTFDAQGGQVSTSSKLISYDGQYGEFPVPTRAGYDFLGWYDSPTGGLWFASYYTVDRPYDQTFYAQWVPKTYTLFFEPQGGQLVTTNKQVTFGTLYGDYPVPQKVGYEFLGWYDSPIGGLRYMDYYTVEQAYDHTLYAQWAPRNYILSFDPTGGEVSISNKRVTYGTLYGEYPVPTRTGYEFLGWYDSPTGGLQYREYFTVEQAYDQTLYARWKANNYVVSFEKQGGTGDAEKIQVTFDEAYGELPALSKTGYVFGGWKTEDGTVVTESSAVHIAANHTLYAEWEPVTVTVSFLVDGKKGFDPITVQYGEVYGVLPVPEKEGYRFTGWYTEKASGSLCDASTVVSSLDDHVLYARWVEECYVVTFDYNGGMGKENEKTKQVVYGDIYGEMPTPVRDGYTFYGWYCYETYGVPYTEESVVKFTKDHTLYARWMPKKYTITFDGRGGSVSEEKMVVTYDTQYASLPVSIRDGYQFMGWFTMEDGGVQLVEGGKVAVTADIKAYAHWQAMNYTLYLNANGGSVQTESKVITVGLKVGELEVPVRAGYQFDGWYTALSGGSLYTGDTTISTTGDVTLYARWKKGTSSASQTTAGQVDQGQEASITISTIKMTGVKTTNYVNKALDLKKAKLIVTYSDGSKKTVTSGYKVNKYSTKAGKRKVTITYGGKQCTLTCSWYDKKAIKKIALDKSKYELYTTATKTIKLKTPYSINQAVSYKSEDSKIASVNSKGVITGKKAGKTKIIVTVNIGTQKKILTMNVVVKDPTIKGGYTFGSKWNTLKFHATLSGGNQKIVWSSSNKKIARIDKRTGKFTGLKDGTVVITAKAGNSKKTFRVLIKTKAKCIIVY